MRLQLANSVASKPKPQVQHAALPWRRRGGALEILLITTLRTRRWIVPKGWPDGALGARESAAREALEEAGVSGEIGEKPVGSFRYIKQRKLGAGVPCRVEVFALEVTAQRRVWAEKNLRELRWCSVAEALALVGEPGLRQVITKFAHGKAAIAH